MLAKSNPSRAMPQILVLLILDFMATFFVVVMTVLCVVALFSSDGALSAKLLVAALWACSIGAAWLFHLLLQDARYRDPFTRRNVSRLNWMGGLVLLPWLLTSGWLNTVTQWTTGNWQFSTPDPGQPPISGLTLALILFGLAGVFRQGVKLREEQELII